MTPDAIRTLFEQSCASARRAPRGPGARRVAIDLDAADIRDALRVALGGERSRFLTIVAVDPLTGPSCVGDSRPLLLLP